MSGNDGLVWHARARGPLTPPTRIMHNSTIADDRKYLMRIYFAALGRGGGTCVLPADASHHAARVRRMRAGDAVVVFDGAGNEARGTILGMARRGLEVELEPAAPVSRESALAICLAQGISTGDRMDYTVQKAVELGATRIQPLATERSVVRLDAERADRRRDHWHAVAASACEQCGRNVIPDIAPVMSLRDWLATVQGQPGTRLTLDPVGEGRLAAIPRQTAVTLLAGPEGGLSEVELGAARQAGFTGIRLGPRTLRTETAAVAAMAAMQTLWGDF